MPWDKESDEYKGWKKDLLVAEDPYRLIQSTLVNQDLAASKDDILDCFAGIMREVGENGTLEAFEKFKKVANDLSTLGGPESQKIADQFYVGDWNYAFSIDPRKTLDQFGKEQRDMRSEFRSAVIGSLRKNFENTPNYWEERLGVSYEEIDGLLAHYSEDYNNLEPSGIRPSDNPLELGASMSGREDEQASEPRADRSVRSDDDLSQLGGGGGDDPAEDVISFVSSSQLNGIGKKGGGIDSLDDEGDPITEAIRKEVLAEQRKVITDALVAANQGVTAEQLNSPENYRNFCLDQDNAAKLEAVFKNPAVKKQLDDVTLAGQQSVMQQFSDENEDPHFSTIKWDGPVTSPSVDSPNTALRSQVVKDENGKSICELSESTRTFSPQQVVKNSKNENVSITKSRLIDMPKGDGSDLDEDVTLHLSLVLKDKDGKAPPKSKAVYFTAHYENGKLVEMSTPTPVKFGPEPYQLGYIEHEGQIYTIPVTKEKYDSMMRTIAQNKGQSEAVNLSQDKDGHMQKDRDKDVQGYGQGGDKGAAPLEEHQEPEVSSLSASAVVTPLPSELGLGSSQLEVPQEISLEVEPSYPLTSTPRPSASMSTRSSREQDLAALEAALQETGDLDKFLDRLMVNDDKTVTLKPASAGEEVAISAEVVQQFLSDKRKEGLVKGPGLIRKFSEVAAEVGKSARGEELSPNSPVSSLSAASSIRHSLSSQSSAQSSHISPSPTPRTGAGAASHKGGSSIST